MTLRRRAGLSAGLALIMIAALLTPPVVAAQFDDVSSSDIARLQSPLSSRTSLVEDRFEAMTFVDLGNDNCVLVPAGSGLRGTVTSVNKAGRIDRKGSLTVVFDQLTVRGRTYPMRATVTQALE